MIRKLYIINLKRIQSVSVKDNNHNFFEINKIKVVVRLNMKFEEFLFLVHTKEETYEFRGSLLSHN